MSIVLLVESQLLAAAIVAEAFEDAGHSVTTAHSTEEAYAQLVEEPRSFSVMLARVDGELGSGVPGLVSHARELNPALEVTYLSNEPGPRPRQVALEDGVRRVYALHRIGDHVAAMSGE